MNHNPWFAYDRNEPEQKIYIKREWATSSKLQMKRSSQGIRFTQALSEPKMRNHIQEDRAKGVELRTKRLSIDTGITEKRIESSHRNYRKPDRTIERELQDERIETSKGNCLNSDRADSDELHESGMSYCERVTCEKTEPH